MSMEIEFLYEDGDGDRQRATFTEEPMADLFRKLRFGDRPDRELLLEVHDYGGGDVE